MTSGHGMHPIQQRKLQCYVKGQTEIGLGGAFVHQRLLAVCCQLVEVTHTLVSLVCDTTCLQLQQDPSCDLGPQDTGVYVTLSNCASWHQHMCTPHAPQCDLKFKHFLLLTTMRHACGLSAPVRMLYPMITSDTWGAAYHEACITH